MGEFRFWVKLSEDFVLSYLHQKYNSCFTIKLPVMQPPQEQQQGQEVEDDIRLLQSKLITTHKKLLKQIEISKQQELTIIQLSKKIIYLENKQSSTIRPNQSNTICDSAITESEDTGSIPRVPKALKWEKQPKTKEKGNPLVPIEEPRKHSKHHSQSRNKQLSPKIQKPVNYNGKISKNSGNPFIDQEQLLRQNQGYRQRLSHLKADVETLKAELLKERTDRHQLIINFEEYVRSTDYQIRLLKEQEMYLEAQRGSRSSQGSFMKTFENEFRKRQQLQQITKVYQNYPEAHLNDNISKLKEDNHKVLNAVRELKLRNIRQQNQDKSLVSRNPVSSDEQMRINLR